MKLAISGKGGVGKTTIAAAFSLLLAEREHRVVAVDADPDANLASALGITIASQHNIVTIASHRELIEERTGAKLNGYGRMFRLNPDVTDIAERFSFQHRGVNLLVLGAVKGGGAGCACPESALLRALVQNVVLRRGEALVMDMEAGIEHMGRATAQGVDFLLAVVEPGHRAVESARRLGVMAADIGIGRFMVILNGVRNDDDMLYLKEQLDTFEVLGCIPYSEAIRNGDRDGVSVLDVIDADTRRRLEGMLDILEQKILDR